MVDKVTLLFLPTQGTKVYLKRDLELADSCARAHVARLTHQRKRARDDKNPRPRKHLPRLSKIDISSSFSSPAQPYPETSSLDLRRPSTFLTVNSRLDNSGVLKLLQYCITVHWPRHDIGSKLLSQRSTFLRAWAEDVLAIDNGGSPAIFHANMWIAAVHLSHEMLMPVSECESLRQKQLALQNISADIEQNHQYISEKSLWVVLILSLPEADTATFAAYIANPTPAFQAPLFDLFRLDVHGRQLRHMEHWSALIDFIESKGGLDTLRDASLAGAIQFADICHSTMSLRYPDLPLHKGYRNIHQRYNRDNLFGHACSTEACQSINIDPSFADVLWTHDLSRWGLSEEVQELFLDLRVWNKVLKLYSRSFNDPDCPKTNLSLVALCRNLLQHRVLQCTSCVFGGVDEVVAETKSIPQDSAPNVGIIIQIDLLIYSVGVLFPTQHCPMWERLIKTLQHHLSMWIPQLLELHDTALTGCLIWSSFLGGLAACQIGNSSARAWFVEFLCHVETRMIGIALAKHDDLPCLDKSFCDHRRKPVLIARSWSDIKTTCLDPLIWSEKACDTAAQKIWDDVHRRLIES